jgi:hypothetical protein
MHMGDTMPDSKQVKFYSAVGVHKDGSRDELDGSFWTDAHAQISGLPEGHRSITYNRAPYFGEAGVGHARAYPYLRVGRIRRRGDWPDTVDGRGTVAPLDLQGVDLFEGAYLVPFGTVNRVAFMGPLRGVVSV